MEPRRIFVSTNNNHFNNHFNVRDEMKSTHSNMKLMFLLLFYINNSVFLQHNYHRDVIIKLYRNSWHYSSLMDFLQFLFLYCQNPWHVPWLTEKINDWFKKNQQRHKGAVNTSLNLYKNFRFLENSACCKN